MDINYDFELILTCKRYNFSTDALLIAQLREVWAERCEIKVSEVRNIDIAEYLIKIADQIYIKHQIYNLNIIKIVSELSPANNWKYNAPMKDFEREDDNKKYWDRVLLIYSSALAQTEVMYIDGLNTYFENVWKKAGKP